MNDAKRTFCGRMGFFVSLHLGSEHITFLSLGLVFPYSSLKSGLARTHTLHAVSL